MTQTPIQTLPITRTSHGFTLIELMITVAIVSILAAIALPSYRQHVIRGKRAAAQSVMMDIANREQQYFLANRSYAGTATVGFNGCALPSDVAANYSCAIAVGTGAVPSYTLTFTAISTQSSDGYLSIDNEGVKRPTGKW